MPCPALPSVFPQGTTQPSFDGFCWNFKLWVFTKLCKQNSSFVQMGRNNKLQEHPHRISSASHCLRETSTSNIKRYLAIFLYSKQGRGKKVKEHSTTAKHCSLKHTPDIPGKTVNVPQYCVESANPAFPFTPWSSKRSFRAYHIPLCHNKRNN